MKEGESSPHSPFFSFFLSVCSVYISTENRGEVKSALYRTLPL